jgi:hypothetical protein
MKTKIPSAVSVEQDRLKGGVALKEENLPENRNG